MKWHFITINFLLIIIKNYNIFSNNVHNSIISIKIKLKTVKQYNNTLKIVNNLNLKLVIIIKKLNIKISIFFYLIL